ncbi:MAG: AIR carboxylase family protein [Chloroflexi bacterium]|nr:AIR carboxylase family protein [Chloroflexota bacterium]MBI3339472.1 AIR carboxylase family protein [Chloroflexota bacterium]
MKPIVVILMGSKADLEHCNKISDACKQFGLDTVLRIASAHKTAEHALKILREYESDPRPKVFITAAGRSNALSGFADGAVSVPVIACPSVSELFGGADIFSSLRMPSGIAPAVVLEPASAALLAAKILGLVDAEVREQVKVSQKRAADKVIEDDASVK